MKSVAGENTDLTFNNEKIHVQTEDWADNCHVIVSRIFKNGSVIKTFRLAYAKIAQVENEEIRKRALQKLHQYVIEKIHSNEI
jgi:acid stress-induced BolA-like protein IbaG/YrbA